MRMFRGMGTTVEGGRSLLPLHTLLPKLQHTDELYLHKVNKAH